MSNQIPQQTPPPSDEIDLGQFFQLIGDAFNRIIKMLLSLFLYLKRNIYILIGLILVGFILGFGLNQVVAKKLKTEVIVKPNLESKMYLYDVVNEIEANIESEDTIFFKELGIDVALLKDFEIMVAPVTKNKKDDLETEMKYLEMLQNFENSGAISDIVRAEILDQSSIDQRVTFFYKESVSGQEYAKKLMDYINSNSYYKEIVETYTENALNRIKENDSLVNQIDELIANYAAKMLKEKPSSEGRLVLDNEQQLNIPGLFNLKNDLIKDIEIKKLELQRRKDAITIINFGKTQQIIKPVYKKNAILFPIILLGLFFLISLIKYVNKKAIGLEK